MTRPYKDLNSHLRETFGCRVQKITVDAGFSCPNRDGTLSSGGCIYCNVRGSGIGAHQKGLSLTEQIEAGKAAMSRRYKAKKFIVYFQAYTNTYGPLDHLKRLYDEALGVSDVVGLSIGTRPDCVDGPVLYLLEGYAKEHLIWIEYGLQSAHDETLQRINRGHDAACFARAVKASRNRGIRICAHVILGLPGESPEQMKETARFIGDLGIDGVKLHLLYVVRGTVLEDLYQRGKYRPLTQTEYVDRVCDFIGELPEEMIIQRLTGDPHKEELVSPEWSLRKRETLQQIADALEGRDIWQGKFRQKD